MNTPIDNSTIREGIFILPCEFKVEGGGTKAKTGTKTKTAAKGRSKSKTPSARSRSKSKTMKYNIETSTHCYNCGKNTQDVNILLNDNVRTSNCRQCRTSRSVFTNP
jgi:hypothetical protein